MENREYEKSLIVKPTFERLVEVEYFYYIISGKEAVWFSLIFNRETVTLFIHPSILFQRVLLPFLIQYILFRL